MKVRTIAHNGVDHTLRDSSHASLGVPVTLDGNGGLFDGEHQSVTARLSCVWWFVGEAEVQRVFGFKRLTAPYDPVRPLVLDGWWTNRRGGVRLAQASWPIRPVTFYAHWTPATRWVVFDANGGQVLDCAARRDYLLCPALSTVLPASMIPGMGQVLPPTRPGMPGLTFAGWYPHANGKGQPLDPTMPVSLSGSLCRVFYAAWRLISDAASSNSLTVSTLSTVGGV